MEIFITHNKNLYRATTNNIRRHDNILLTSFWKGGEADRREAENCEITFQGTIVFPNGEKIRDVWIDTYQEYLD
jgi:hypothetical protein